MSGELKNSMQNLDNRFRSNGIGELEIVYAYLYPNLQELVNQNEILPAGNKLIYDLRGLREDMSPFVVSVHFWSGVVYCTIKST